MSDKKNNLNTAIEVLVDDKINQMPANNTGVISKTYDDGSVDIMLNDENVLRHITCVGDNSMGNPVLLLFLNNDITKPIAMSDNSNLIKQTNDYIGNIIDFIINGA